MNLDPARLTRGPVISQYQIGRGGTAGKSKMGMSQKMMSADNLRASLNIVHQRIRGCSSALQLTDLLDEYVGLATLLALSFRNTNSILNRGGLSVGTNMALSAATIAAPFIPGGSVVSAAISGLSQLKDAAAGTSGGIGGTSGG